jgi:hypothetical protein
MGNAREAKGGWLKKVPCTKKMPEKITSVIDRSLKQCLGNFL